MASIHPNTHVTAEQIAAFCERNPINQMELFGSILRDDFDEDSDIDVLVVFAPDAKVSMFSHMEDEPPPGLAARSTSSSGAPSKIARTGSGGGASSQHHS